MAIANEFFVVEIATASRGSVYYYSTKGPVYTLEKADRINDKPTAEEIVKKLYGMFPDSEPRQYRVEVCEVYETIRKVKDRPSDDE